jgi:hypothetical protein
MPDQQNGSLQDYFKSVGGGISSGNPSQAMSSSQVDLANQQVKLGSATAGAIAQYPGLHDQIQAIASGTNHSTGALGTLGKFVFDNPISKTLFSAGTVMTYPKNAIVSTLRETMDALDFDKKTHASFKDLFNQAKDTHYGFGTAFPMKGNWGRAIGLIGDVALDPMTYASLGATVPEELILKGAQEAEIALKGLEAGSDAYKAVEAEQSLRAALGTSHIAGREGRVALAGLVDRMGGSAELVKNTAMQGRRAFRLTEEGAAMAEKIGLNRSGVYMFGSRFRVPMTGPLADALEFGLVKTRLGIMGSAPMDWLARNMSLTGTDAARSMREINYALSTGKFDKVQGLVSKVLGDNEKAKFFVQMVGADNYARAERKIVQDTFRKNLAPLLADEDVRAAGTTVYQFLDTNPSTWERPMTEVEQRAYDKLKGAFAGYHDDVMKRMTLVDNNFQIGEIKDYFPHMMSQDAQEWLARKSNATRAEEIMKYLKTNMADPAKSFKSRAMEEGKVFFGHALTKDDMNKGIDFLNQLANEGGFPAGKKFFETDIPTVMEKYGSHYAQQFGTAEFLQKLVDSGGLKMAKETSYVSDEFVKSSMEHAKQSKQIVSSRLDEMMKAGKDAATGASVFLDALRAKSGLVGGELDALKLAEKKIGSVEDAAKVLETARVSFKQKLDDVISQWTNFKQQFETQTNIVDALDSAVNNVQQSMSETEQSIAELLTTYQNDISAMGAQVGQPLGDVKYVYGGKEMTVDEVQKSIIDKMKKAQSDLVIAQKALDEVPKDANFMNDLLSTGVDINTGTGVENLDEVVSILNHQGVRDAGFVGGSSKKMGGKGALSKTKFTSLWNDAEQMGPEMQLLKSRIDPTGSVKSETLRKIFLEDTKDSKGVLVPGIRTRIARATTTADNLQELREAGVWLLMRDMHINPSFVKDMSPTNEAFTRFENLTNLIEQADTAQAIAGGRTKAISSASIKATETGNITEALSALEKTRASIQEGIQLSQDAWHSLPEAEVTDALGEAYQLEQFNLGNRLNSTTKRIAELKGKLPKQSQLAANRVVQLNGYKEIVADLGAAVSEYYLHRETTLQMGRIAEILSKEGLMPTQSMYNRVLSSVAKGELKHNVDFMESISEVKGVFDKIKKSVDSISIAEGDINKNIKFREEFSKIFNAGIETRRPEYITGRGQIAAWNKEQKDLLRAKELLSEHFPELENMWRESQNGSTNRLFYRHPDAKNLQDDVVNELKKYGITPDFGTGVNRGARRVNLAEKKSIDELGVTGRSVSVEAQAARYDSMRGNIDGAIKELDNILAKKYLPKVEEGLTTNLGKEYQIQVRQQLKDVVSEYRDRYNQIIDQVNKERELAQKASEKAFGVKGAKSSAKALKGAVQGGEDYGFSRLMARALNGSSDFTVNDFFAELVGGNKYKAGTDYTSTRLRAGKLIRQSRGKKEFTSIAEFDSYFGKIAQRTQSRIRGLNLLVDDTTIPTEFLKIGVPGTYKNGKWIAGSWALRKDLRGANGLADSLESHADNLLRSVGETKSFNSELKLQERALNRAQGGGRKVTSPSPSIVRDYTEYNQLHGIMTKMETDPLHVRALQHKDEQAFAQTLSRMSPDFSQSETIQGQIEMHTNNISANQMQIDNLMKERIELITNNNEIVNGNDFRRIDQSIPSTVDAVDAATIDRYKNNLSAINSAEETLKELNKANSISKNTIASLQQRAGQIDGTFLGFTEPEWNALWNERPEGQLLSGLKKERVAAQKELERLNPPSSERYIKMYGKPTPQTNNYLMRVESAKAKIASLDEVIAMHESRNSAMEKFGQLFQDYYGRAQAHPEQKTASDLLEQFRKDSKTLLETKSVRNSRDSLLENRYITSKEAQHLDAYKSIQDQMQQSKYSSFLKDREAVIQHQDNLRIEIARLRGDVADKIKEVSDFQNKVVKTLEEGGITSKATSPEGLAKRAKGAAENIRNTNQVTYGVDKEMQRGIKLQLTSQLGREPTKAELVAEIESVKTGISNTTRKNTIDKLTIELQRTPTKSEINNALKLVATGEQRPAQQFIALDPAKTLESQIQNKDAAITAKLTVEEMQSHLEQLNFDQIVEANLQSDALDALNQMTDIRKRQMAVKLKAVKELDNQLGVSERLAATGSKFPKKFNDVFESAGKTLRNAEVKFDIAKDFENWGPQRIQEVQKNITDLRKLAENGRYIRGEIKKADQSWMDELDKFLNESGYLISQLSGDNDFNSIFNSEVVRKLTNNYLDSQSAWLDATHDLSVARREAVQAKGLKTWVKAEGKGASINWESVRQIAPEGALKTKMAFDDGFVQISKYFPNIGVHKELQDLVTNVHRITEPAVARELAQFTGKYTRFFKAYATLSPGFHVRNSFQNAFMLFAAGGKFSNLKEGLEVSRSWIEASKAGKTFEEWIVKQPEKLQGRIRTAFEAAASSGGGMTGEYLNEITPLGTAKSKEFGKWIEQHSRFMMAYDGVAQGLDMNMASARVKRFLIDYENTSTVDKSLRQIIPFWMWTSRNLPMQISNMWLNPKAYEIYNNIKNNLGADQKVDVVPSWMSEMGSWKLPFGKQLYIQPDLGFTRIDQQIAELRDPARYLSNVNPLLRLPIELAGTRQYYNNRPFSTTPVEAKGMVANILQPFLQAAGYGQTGQDGKKYVNDKAYYALRNLIPLMGTAERLTPSVDTYTQRGGANALLGFAGIPVRQLKESEQSSELKRRMRELTNLTKNQKAVGG